MPSLRKRVSSYLRQLSFHNEPRDKRNNVNENAFVTKYLEGYITLREGPPIIYGKNPTDLPNYELGQYTSGCGTIIGCYSGPNGGLTTVRRTEKHLSVPDDDIDFIDNPEEEPIPPPVSKKSPNRITGQPIDNTTMVIKVAGNEYCVTNKPKRHSKSFSLGSISDLNVEVEKTKIDKAFYSYDNKTDENSNQKNTKSIRENESECDKNGIALVGGGENKECNRQKSVQNTNMTNKNNVTINQPKEFTSVRQEPHRAKSNKSHQKPTASNHSKEKLSKHHTSSHRNDIPTKSSPKAETNVPKTEKHHVLAKSRNEANPNNQKKRGKIIQVQRPQTYRGITLARHGI